MLKICRSRNRDFGIANQTIFKHADVANLVIKIFGLCIHYEKDRKHEIDGFY